MQLLALALDYDGTIATHDRLDPDVRSAIAAARAAGIMVLLVTGRILGELRRVAGDLHFVDAVVAENGAVLHFPDSGYTTTLAPPIPAAYVEALVRRGVEHQAGTALVDAAASDAPALLDAIRTTRLPLVLLFNAGRVMTLPQGVSKATGLHALLDMLRLSAHNVVAVGDAENDHELLRLAGAGAAVQWGSPALRAGADLELAGSGPSAVATFIRSLIETPRVPQPQRARRRLRLGHSADGREFSLAVRGRNVLVAGDAKSGKSWVAGLLCEQLILHGFCVCVIDPEGDYRTLEALPGVTVLGGADPPPTPRELARALRYPDRSVVIDLSRQPQDEKADYIRTILPELNALRRRHGFPHRIVVDEAHYFLHDADALRLLDLDHNGYTFITYWASRLPPALLDATEVLIVTRESNPVELAAMRGRCGTCGESGDWTSIEQLATGQAAALPVTAEAGGQVTTFTLGPRLTPHVRHREKYVDLPISEARAFVFGGGRPGGAPARTLRQFVTALETHPPADLLPFMQRHDFSRWLRDVFGDHPLATQVEGYERRPEHAAEALADIARAIRSRYDLTTT